MAQYHAWDYTKPYYYMVTLKRLPHLPPLARLDANDAWGFDRTHPITRAFAEEIAQFVARSPGIAAIKPYIIMPDHLHLLVKIADVPGHLSLKQYVAMLKGLLRRRFKTETGIESPLFETEWHDFICKKAHQLCNFRNYIIRNPENALLRQSHPDRFHCYRGYRHWRLGNRACDLVGNPELLDEPAFVAVRISRSVLAGSPEWRRLEAFYGQWRPGGTAVGTWYSKGEQMARQKILAAGGNVIALDPDGFGVRWHPTGDDAQRLCAEGRLLYLSPYAPHTAQLPPGEKRARCLALNEMAEAMQNVAAPE